MKRGPMFDSDSATRPDCAQASCRDQEEEDEDRAASRRKPGQAATVPASPPRWPATRSAVACPAFTQSPIETPPRELAQK